MGSVTLYRRGKIWHCKWLLESGKYKRKSLGKVSKSDAQKVAQAMERKMLLGQYDIETSRDYEYGHVLDLFDAWAPHHLSAQTAYLYRTFFSQLFIHTCRETLSSVKPGDVEEWKLSLLDKGQKATTVNAKLRQCRAVFKFAAKHPKLRWNGRDPFETIERIKEPKRLPKFLTRDQVHQFLWAAAVEGKDVYLAVLLGAFAGLRKKEIDSALWSWINWERGTITVTPSDRFATKTDSSAKTIPLHPRLRIDLPIIWEWLGRPEGYVLAPDNPLPPARAGAVPYRFNFKHYFGRAAKKSGFAVTPHTLRHSLATAMAEGSFSSFEIMQMLRHSSPRSTAIYVHNRAEKINLEGIL